jgi:asparagine synthetase B (glutamine-hydrolysing)
MNGWLVRFDAARDQFEAEIGESAAHADEDGCRAVVAADRAAGSVAASLASATTPVSPAAVAAGVRYLSRKRRLELVRDRTGLHPLFYAIRDGTLIAGTDLRAIVAHPEIQARPSARVVKAWLDDRRLAPSETLFENVWRVPAGHVAECTSDGVTMRRVWQPPASGSYPRSAAGQFGDLLEAAASRIIVLGRPAVFLSGGLDSASVATAFATVSHPIALCVDFVDASEAATQRAVAEGLLLQREEAQARRDPELVDRALELVRESLWPVAAPWAPVFEELAERARRRGAGVLVDGLGGDELLDAGYAAGRALLRRPWWLMSWLRAERLYTGGASASLRALVKRGSIGYDGERRRDVIDAGASMQREDSYDRGLRTGLPRRHPLWDAALVDLVDGLPPEALVASGDPKSPARGYVRGRIQEISGDWPRPLVADRLAAALREGLERCVVDRGMPHLQRLGVAPALSDPSALPFGRLWPMLSVESWLEGVELWGKGS